MDKARPWAVLGSVTVILSSVAFAAASVSGNVVRPARTVVARQQQQMLVAAQAMQGIEFPTTARTLVGKAQPDECFVAPLDPSNVYPATLPCDVGARPKVNQGYAWSMTEAAGNIWFGTVANPLCAVLGGFLGVSDDVVTSSFACELSGSPIADLRPPQIWLHRPPPVGSLQNVTPDLPLIDLTAGMRAAGAYGNVVLIGGPQLSPAGGINLFAFNASARSFIAAATVNGPAPPDAPDYTVYTDMRTFVVANGALYAGVKYEKRATPTGAATERGGKVLRWTGSTGSPFLFEEVATLTSEVAYLAFHEGRLFASTWPVVDPSAVGPFPANVVLAGVWMSPELGGNGVLDAADGAWTGIWQADDYEPDPLVAATYGGGAIASFDGVLFWGTMHVPFFATMAHFSVYQGYYSLLSDATTPTLQQAVVTAMLGTQRAGKVFGGVNLTTAPEVRLLYGLPAVPVFTFNAGDPITSSWSTPPNNMSDPLPEYGLSGFGNLLNNYIWSMQVHGNRLWVGTMDWSYLIYDLAWTALEAVLGEDLEIPPGALPEALEEYIECVMDAEETATIFGADLYYFPGGDRPAFPESIGGVGNYTNYGVRSMASAPSGLYIGTANPMNLLTDTTDDVPEGGWEVLRLVDLPENTPAGSNVVVTLGDGTTVTLCGVDEPGHTVGTFVPAPCCGLWMPVPPQYQAPQQMLLIGSSARLSEEGGCSSTGPVTVCMPVTGGLVRLYQPVLSGTPPNLTFTWEDITGAIEGGRVCGQLQEGSQELLQQLGYQGYLGVVVGLQLHDPVPALSAWGVAALALLLAAAGLLALKTRLG